MEAESPGATEHHLHRRKDRCRLTGEAWETPWARVRVQGGSLQNALLGDPPPSRDEDGRGKRHRFKEGSLAQADGVKG